MVFIYYTETGGYINTKTRYNFCDKELFDGYLFEIICTENAKS